MKKLKYGILCLALATAALFIFCVYREHKKDVPPVPKEFTLSAYETFPTEVGEAKAPSLTSTSKA